MAMETLMTFTFDAPPTIRRVELLGSWDNFTHAYPMHVDQRRGQGHWTGCFQFANIIFDGEQYSPPRCGGLYQGGIYWYFFRLNDHVEAYDDQRENTVECPLLPGQPVNVIEIPLDLDEEDTSPTLDISMIERVRRAMRLKHEYTLDPESRYRPLSRPSSFSRPHRKQSTERKRAETEVTSLPASLADLGTTLMQVDTAPAQHHDGTVERPLLAEYNITTYEQNMDYEMQLQGGYEGHEDKKATSISTEQSYAATIDISTASATPVWKGIPKFHMRSMSSTDRCYRVDSPHEPQWRNPSKSLLQSLRKYYFVAT